MQLNPTEEDRLRVFTAAQLARQTLARGLPLNAPEAVAFICDEMHMVGRGGASYQEVDAAAHQLASETPVMEGVADLVAEIRCEVLLEEGTRLFVLREPFGPASPDGPGSTLLGAGDVPLLPGRERRRITVTNEGTRPIRVSSHFPFWQVNASLSFDREATRGFRLDIPAGDSIRWAPGEAKEIELVAYAGGTGDA